MSLKRSVARVVRPRRRLKYPKCRRELAIDFGHRCAYCMVHELHLGERSFEIDHFKPRAKKGSHGYVNLCWACHVCNKIKGEKWPTREMLRRGVRFLNPCEEQDYGIHFVEGEDNYLAPDSDAGSYHCESLMLDRSDLVVWRRNRDELRKGLMQLKKLLVDAQANPLTPQRREELVGIRGTVRHLESMLDIAVPRIEKAA